MSNTHKKGLFPYFIWFIPLTFFAYQFILRNSPGILIDDLMQKFSINAGEFAMFSSMFYVAYAIMQIPAGLLLDKFRPGIIIALLILCFVTGAYFFSNTNNFYFAVFARILMGIGSTAGFLGAAKVISLYFPKHKYSFLISLTFSGGFLGAIYGGKPFSVLVTELGWENMFHLFSFFGSIIAFCSFLFINKKNSNVKDDEIVDQEESFFKGFVEIITNRKILKVALAGGFMMGSTEGFADAWGVKYINVIFGLSKSDASLIVSMVYLGLCFGGPFLVYLTRKTSNDYIMTFVTGIIMLLGFIVILFANNLTFLTLFLICLVIGVCSGSQVLIFSITDSLTLPKNAALTAALTNSIVMSFGLIIHQLIGFFLDMAGDDSFNPYYFKLAIGVIPVLMSIGSISILRVYIKHR